MKTSLKWEEKASKELIIVVCEFQMARAQSNARPVSKEIRKATLAHLLETFGIASLCRAKPGVKKRYIQPPHLNSLQGWPWDWQRQTEGV